MTYQEKVYKREQILNEFEATIDIYLQSTFLSMEETLTLIKQKHAEITAELDKVHSDYISAPKPKDPFKD